MPRINTPIQLKNEVLSRLGSPVHTIEVTNDQVNRCIDRAVSKFIDYHYDGVNKQYIMCQLTEDDITRGYMILDAPVTAVTKVTIADSDGTTGWYDGAIFDVFWHQAQDIVEHLRSFGGSSQVLSSYEGFKMYQETFKMLTSPPPDYHYNTKTRQLKIFDRDLCVGTPISIECYIASATFVSLTELLPNQKFESPPTAENSPAHQNYTDPRDFKILVENSDNDTPPETYFTQECYGDWWLQDYVTALVKYQWGQNLWKYEGQSLPGGVTVSGQSLKDEAKEEIEKLDEYLLTLEAPLEFFLA